MGQTLNGVPFRQIWLPKDKYPIKAPFAMVSKKVTLHETDNEMSAEKEIKYMNSNNNETSYHFAIDEKEVIQAIPTNRNGWHAGDGLNGYGNRNTLAFELCRNYDRTRKTTALLEPLSTKYQKAVANLIKAVPQVMINEGLVANMNTISDHNSWNGKWCPRKMLNDGTLSIVKAGIISEYNRLKGIENKPVKPVSPKKEDGHLSLSQVVDKTIAGGYGSYPQREKNINNKTNFTYKRVQDAVNAKIKAAVKPKPAPKPVVKPKPSAISYKENGTFYPNDTIIVRNQPSTNGNIIARYYKGEKVTYHTVHLKNGYVWLQYNRSNGKQGYIPCRTYSNGKYGTLWGTIK